LVLFSIEGIAHAWEIYRMKKRLYRQMKSRLLACALFAPMMILAACSSEVVRSPTTLAPAGQGDRVQVRLQSPVLVESSSGYARNLPAGSVWEYHGSIAQGQVYRRVDGILTVEGAQVHEAFVVVSGDRLVGFYLPVEQAFSPARKAVAASFVK
jgi:hypothetical protein